MTLLHDICYFFKEIYYHTPDEELNEQEIQMIKNTGLIHFCMQENTNSIVEKGVLGNYKNYMCKKEKGFSWFYIYNPLDVRDKYEIIRHKGERKNYNAYVIVSDLSDQQLKKLRIRRKTDCAVIYPESLFTPSIKPYSINTILNSQELDARRKFSMKEVAKFFTAFGVVGTVGGFAIAADVGCTWAWILFFVSILMLLVGICMGSAARKHEQQNNVQSDSLAQAQGALAERQAMIAKMKANGMSDEDIQKYLH